MKEKGATQGELQWDQVTANVNKTVIMSIITARDNENKRWKRKGKKQKQKRNKDPMQVIVKMWELNDFVVRFS